MAFPAFLDACVLVPINLTEVMLRLASAKAFRPLWSADVLAEVQRTLPKVGVTPEKAEQRINVMRTHFPDAEVTGYQGLIPKMSCDQKDRHVLAAAVRANAELIVTSNLKDFPNSALAPYDIDVVRPDHFLLDQLDLYPEITMDCLNKIVAARQQPQENLEVFLTKLEKTAPRFSKQAREVSRNS